MANENEQHTESADAKPAAKKTTTRRKTTRKSSSTAKKKDVTADKSATSEKAVTSDDASGEAAPKKKTTRRKSSSSRTKKAAESTDAKSTETSEDAPKKKTTRRKFSSSRTKKAAETDEASEDAPRKRTTRRKSSSSRTKQDDSGEAAPRKTTRRKSARASEPTVLESADPTEDFQEVDASPLDAPAPEETATRRSASTRSRKTSSKTSSSSADQKPSRNSSRKKDEGAEESIAQDEPKGPAQPRAKKKPAPAPEPAKKISEVASNFLANFSSRGAKPVAQDEDDVKVPSLKIPAHPTSDEPADLLAQGTAWLDSLFAAMGLAITSVGHFDEQAEQVEFNLSGDDLSRILGPRERSPKILETVEKVLSVFFEQAGYRNAKVFVDCDGFRSAQGVRIKQVAEALASLTEELDSELFVAGLNDFERRIIHRHIGEGRGLQTESVGYGSFRKLRLQPE